MQWQRLKTELLRAVRGKRSQNTLSRKLGYTFNQVYRWESGAKRITWSEWVKYCQACKVNLSHVLKNNLHYVDDPYRSDLLIRRMISKTSAMELAKNLGLSRYITARWLSGEVSPSLEAVLEMIDMYPQILTAFISELADINEIPSLKTRRDLEQFEKQLHWDYPMAALVIRCFDLKSYTDLKRHQHGFVSRKLKIDLKTERFLIEQLSSINAIKFQNDKYVPVKNTLSTKGTFEEGKGIRLHWMKETAVQLQGLKDALPNEAFGYLIYSCNIETQKIIHEKYVEFYNAVRQLTANQPEPVDHIWAMNVQIFPLSH